MRNLRILLAEDMEHERLLIEANLTRALSPHIEPEFTIVDNAEAAVAYSRTGQFDLAILDIDFSHSPHSKGMTGLQAAKQIKAQNANIYSVIVSADDQEATMNWAVDACDVDWYLRRAKMSYDELAWVARQALLSRLHREGSLLESRYQFFTNCKNTKRFLRAIDRILPQQNTLIFGETGTGKELVARRIHANAKAFEKNRPLQVLDCSSINPQLFESEIFGHRKGAYTGANSDRVGAIQLANGGDLFLDEIHNIPIHLQQKLLRVLNDGVLKPVGSNEEIRSNFRIIAATNIPIQEAIKSGKLLPDFVERIRKIRLEIPALRERQDDIPVLISKQLELSGSFDKEFSKDAIELMKGLPWNGNIRELKSFVDTAVAEVKVPIIARSHLLALLPKESKTPATLEVPVSDGSLVASLIRDLLEKNIPLSTAIEQMEESYLLKVTGPSSSLRDLAKSTGYSKTTLIRRLKKLGRVPQDTP